MTYDPSSFIEDCLRTEAPITPEVQKRMLKCARLLHAAMGKATEIGEFIDELKRHMFYGKPLDIVNLGEEIADGWWYDAIAADFMNFTVADLMKRVVNKLKKRFPEKFAEHEALNRNLEEERKELEGKPNHIRYLDRPESSESPVIWEEKTGLYTDPFQLYRVDASKVAYENMVDRFFSVEAVSLDSAYHKATLEIMKGAEFKNPNEEMPKLYHQIRSTLSITIME